MKKFIKFRQSATSAICSPPNLERSLTSYCSDIQYFDENLMFLHWKLKIETKPQRGPWNLLIIYGATVLQSYLKPLPKVYWF